MSVTLINEVREKEAMETKDRMEIRLKSVTGGYNLELIRAYAMGLKAIMIQVEGEGILKATFAPSIPPEFN